MPNFSTTIFDTTEISTSNFYSQLENSTHDISTISSPGAPTAQSSPKQKHHQQRKVPKLKHNLKILVVNCRSLPVDNAKQNKPKELELMIESTDADIIVGTESWLYSSINDSEVFPDSHIAFRKDRNRHGGGVFILVRNNLISSSCT